VSLGDFREFTRELVLDNGKRMALYPEQEWMLSDYFGGVRETLIPDRQEGGQDAPVRSSGPPERSGSWMRVCCGRLRAVERSEGPLAPRSC
jgi:hypothetical protein